MATPNPAPTSLHTPSAVRENTGYLLARLGDISAARFSEALETLGLRPRHYAVLSTLMEQDQIASQHAIGGCLSIDPSTMVAVVDELEQRGLLTRHRDPADRRRYLISLTDDGRSAQRACRRVALRCEDELLSPLPDERRDALRDLLQALLAAHDD